MKKNPFLPALRRAVFSLIALVFLALGLTSCYQSQDDDIMAEAVADVRFSFTPYGIQNDMTRALAAPSNLLIIDKFNGVTTYKEYTSLSDVSLPLDYGTHELYFVAAVTKWTEVNTTSLVVDWSHTGFRVVWAKALSLTVSSATTAQNIELPLVVSSITVSSLDVIPADAKMMTIDAPNMCHSIDLTTMKGIIRESDKLLANIDISSKIGSVFNLTLIQFVNDSGSAGDITLTTHTSSNQEISSRTLESAPIQAGYITAYSGYLFSDGIATTITYTTDWIGTNNYSF